MCSKGDRFYWERINLIKIIFFTSNFNNSIFAKLKEKINEMISIIVPVWNEQDNIIPFIKEVNYHLKIENMKLYLLLILHG